MPNCPQHAQFAGKMQAGGARVRTGGNVRIGFFLDIDDELVGLHDARQTMLSIESRFDLAYNAAHAGALAALRTHGYRSENRYDARRQFNID